MSKYDYRDPATDPAYCAGLEPEHGEYDERLYPEGWDDDEPPFEYWSEEYTGDLCIWCQQPVPAVEGHHTSRWHPYCSSLCEHQAEMDSLGEY